MINLKIMGENRDKKSLPPSAPFHSETDGDLLLRRIFAAYDRFSPILARFLKKEFAATVGVSLQTVERTESPFFAGGWKSEVPIFRIDPVGDGLSLWIECSAPFLFAAVDRLLGSELFLPESHTDEATELDRKLAPLLIDRLAELFLEFSGLVGGEFFPSVWITAPSSPQKRDAAFLEATRFFQDAPPGVAERSSGDESGDPFPSSPVYDLLRWEITCQNESYSLVFFLPESLTTARPLPNFTDSGDFSSKTVDFSDDLSHYIEARRSVRGRPAILGTEVETGAERVSEEAPKKGNRETGRGTAEIQVLAGTLKIAPDELAEMKAGDLLVTDLPVSAPFLVRVDDVPVFWGRPGEFQGENAVEILDEALSKRGTPTESQTEDRLRP